MQDQSFILGVNYWPRRKAMYWWRRFDLGEVREEFHQIAELGLKLARIFLLWEDWQPDPSTVSQTALHDLETVCEVAVETGLELDITFFTGHMSGPNWVPGWLIRPSSPKPPQVRQVVSGGQVIDSSYANLFSDAEVQQPAEHLVVEVVSALKDHPAVKFWNLGNEPDLFAVPSNHLQSRDWVRRFTGAVRRIDPAHSVTIGLHVPNLIEDNGFRANEVFSEVDFAAIHGYPMYADWSAGPLDPEFVPFLCALTTSLCGKPTLAEEFGGPTAAPGSNSYTLEWQAYGRQMSQFIASEDEFAAYITQTLPRLVEVGALGAVLWCFADYAPDLYDRPPCDQAWHERFFGLVRPDGTLKPHADVIRQFAQTEPRVQPARRMVQLDVSPEEFYRSPGEHTRRLYQDFRR